MGHERLRRSDEVRAVLRRGRRCARTSVVLHALERGDDGPTRVAVVASRRVGTAVERNRAKRVLRAAAAASALPRGVDVALVARDATPSSSSAVAAAELRSCIEHMFDTNDGREATLVDDAGGHR